MSKPTGKLRRISFFDDAHNYLREWQRNFRKQKQQKKLLIKKYCIVCNGILDTVKKRKFCSHSCKEKFRNQKPHRKLAQMERLKKWIKDNPELVKIRQREKENRKRLGVSKKQISALTIPEIKPPIMRRPDEMNYYIASKLRARVRAALNHRGIKKKNKTFSLVGISSIDELKKHIETQFKPGMNWKNTELDHIIPCASFDLTKEEEQKKCFHYSNLQPLWPSENRKKWKKIIA